MGFSQQSSPSRAALILLSAALVMIGPGAALAHSWYPYECCDDDDCAPVTAIEKRELGRSSTMTTRHGRTRVPDRFPRRPSPDDQIHLCVIETPHGLIPRCLFVPEQQRGTS